MIWLQSILSRLNEHTGCPLKTPSVFSSWLFYRTRQWICVGTRFSESVQMFSFCNIRTAHISYRSRTNSQLYITMYTIFIDSGGLFVCINLVCSILACPGVCNVLNTMTIHITCACYRISTISFFKVLLRFATVIFYWVATDLRPLCINLSTFIILGTEN